MKARALFALMAGLYLLALSSLASAQKLRLGSAVRTNPLVYLTVFAAEEKGFWKENGLEVEWLLFENSPALFRAMAAKELFIGMEAALSAILAASRGLPVKILAQLDPVEGFSLWVSAKSPVREPKQFKGRIGTLALGSVAHAYAQVIAKGLGIEKEVKFVGVGGAGPAIAALKVGSIDATVTTFFVLMELKIKGEVRDLVTADEFLPRPWLGRVAWAHTEFIKEKPDTVRKMVRAMLQSTSYWKKDSAWAIARIKKEVGISEEAAREIYKIMRPSENGKLERKAIENATAFLVEYNLVGRGEKAPPVDELYTDEFVRPR